MGDGMLQWKRKYKHAPVVALGSASWGRDVRTSQDGVDGYSRDFCHSERRVFYNPGARESVYSYSNSLDGCFVGIWADCSTFRSFRTLPVSEFVCVRGFARSGTLRRLWQPDRKTYRSSQTTELPQQAVLISSCTPQGLPHWRGRMTTWDMRGKKSLLNSESVDSRHPRRHPLLFASSHVGPPVRRHTRRRETLIVLHSIGSYHQTPHPRLRWSHQTTTRSSGTARRPSSGP